MLNGKRFKVYDDYKLKLKAYSKKRFDPFCRYQKISIPYNLRYRSDNSHITLFWENLLLTDGQVKAYTVYRRTGAEQGFTRITPSPISAFTNTYTDSVTFGGKTAEYSVASIGPDGVESQKSAALTVELPLNEKIQINRISLIRNGESVIVRWPIVADKG